MNISNQSEKIVKYKNISENYKNITLDIFDNSILEINKNKNDFDINKYIETHLKIKENKLN